MFSRNAPPSILSRGCRYILRASRHHHHHHRRQSPLHLHSQGQSPSLARPLSLSLSLRTRTPSSLLSQPPRITTRAYSTIHTTETTTMADASETGVSADSLRTKLIEQLQAQYVEIEDLSGGCGQAFMAIIVSPQFESKNMLARHRLVNAALKSEIAAIHAWTPKCFTPEQWLSMQQ